MTHSRGLGRVLPFAALMLSAMLSACASHGNKDELEAHNQQLQTENQQLQTQNQQLQAQNQQLQAQIASLQGETRFVEAGDLLFPSGGYELSPAGKTELSNNIVPKLTGLQNAKVVVYGYTNSTPVGPQLKQQGINDKSDLIVATGRCGCNLPGLAGRKRKHHLGQRVRRDPSHRLERHAGGTGEESPHRHHRAGPGRPDH